jgi:hypothetical protein
MGEIEHDGAATNLLERGGVSTARRFQVGRFHWHRVDLFGA